MLTTARLTNIRNAYLRVLNEGMINRACRDHEPQDTIVVSNGGTPILVVANGAGTGSAPDDLTCWNEAATALHAALNDAFPSAHQR